MNDGAIGRELGQRVRTTRLNKNMTQQEIADFTGLSTTTVKRVEQGKGTILSLIKILRALKGLDAFDAFLPRPELSPRQLALLKGKERQRAARSRKP